MVEVTVRLFAAAAQAAGADEVRVAPGSLSQVLDEVRRTAVDPSRFAHVLAQCSVLVDGLVTDQETDPAVTASTPVDILPPFAGG